MNITRKKRIIFQFLIGFTVLFSMGVFFTIGTIYQENTEVKNNINEIDLKGSSIVPNKAKGVLICNAEFFQYYPVIVSDEDGGAIIAWHDDREDRLEYDIYAQRINSSGHPLWKTNGTVICNLPGDQNRIQLTTDTLGGAIITWQDFRESPGRVYIQRINSSGHCLWGANGTIVSNASGSQKYPRLISDGNGGAIVVWEDSRNGNEDIYVQKISPEGQLLWGENGTVVCTRSEKQTFPIIICDGSNGAIIVWDDERKGENDCDIYAQRINSSGTACWILNGVSVCNASGNQFLGDVINDNSGNVYATWEDQRSGRDIYMQKIDQNGFLQWDSNGLVICNAPGDQGHPSLISDGDEGAILMWIDGRGENLYLWDIYLQNVNSSGTIQWTYNGIKLCNYVGYKYRPELTSDGNGGAFITWEDHRTGNGKIYAQKINSLGMEQWRTNGVCIDSKGSSQSTPELVSDGTGGIIISWCGSGPGANNIDIYAQRLNSAGTLQWIDPANSAIPGFDMTITSLILMFSIISICLILLIDKKKQFNSLKT
ncbi:MAG: hypothetical protein JW891_18670 [Candidatus Lokiarchaeota archaeon]|nr:hypothetical protein [Candidatus Lokiarchaeota archaeon]